MSILRYSAKRDANELEIVNALENAGCLVQRLSGGGVPDLLVWAPDLDALILVEVKIKKKRNMKNPLQQAWRGKWRAAGAQVYVVESAEEILAIVCDRSKRKTQK